MKNIFLKIMLVIIPLLILSTLKSQSVCPPSGGGSWTNSSVAYSTPYYGSQGSVSTQYRGGYNNYELVIDWTTLNNSSEFMSNDVLKEILRKEAILSIGWEHTWDHNWEGTVTIYYQTDCTVQQKVAFNVVTIQDFACCDDGGDPTRWWLKTLLDQNGIVTERTLYLYKTIVCGHKCCKKTYELEILYNSVEEEWQPYIKEGIPVPFEVTGCDCEIEYRDCEPPYDVIVPTGQCR